jgi:hypothetical protein
MFCCAQIYRLELLMFQFWLASAPKRSRYRDASGRRVDRVHTAGQPKLRDKFALRLDIDQDDDRLQLETKHGAILGFLSAKCRGSYCHSDLYDSDVRAQCDVLRAHGFKYEQLLVFKINEVFPIDPDWPLRSASYIKRRSNSPYFNAIFGQYHADLAAQIISTFPDAAQRFEDINQALVITIPLVLALAIIDRSSSILVLPGCPDPCQANARFSKWLEAILKPIQDVVLALNPPAADATDYIFRDNDFSVLNDDLRIILSTLPESHPNRDKILQYITSIQYRLDEGRNEFKFTDRRDPKYFIELIRIVLFGAYLRSSESLARTLRKACEIVLPESFMAGVNDMIENSLAAKLGKGEVSRARLTLDCA